VRFEPLRPHAPEERDLVGGAGGWQVRAYPAGRHAAGRGFLHVQLWDPAAGISILTPSRLTGGCFEVWTPAAGRCGLVLWAQVERALAGVVVPGPAEIAALERWFVLRHEPAEIHLLRTWWSSAPRARRRA
jgi:hypothetical protein